MQLTEATNIVQDLVYEWSDAKLIRVLEFAEAGGMKFDATCNCLLGVASSNEPHTWRHCPRRFHYHDFHDFYPGAARAERAYLMLGFKHTSLRSVWLTRWGFFGSQQLRDQRFIAILKQVISERSVALTIEAETRFVLV